MTPILDVDGLSVFYGKAIAVDDASLRVGEGQIVSVIGPNGAGKTSLLSAIMGALPAKGRISFRGHAMEGQALEDRVGAGIRLVPESRALFGGMSVLDNLLVGCFQRRRDGNAALLRSIDEVYGLFPRLRDRASQMASTLSGGERQMLALGRALVGNPSLLMLDEPSLGLAPKVVAEILSTVQRLRDTGMAILLVEQNARAALQISDYGYVLEQGRVVIEGLAATLRSDPTIVAAYLGLPGEPT